MKLSVSIQVSSLIALCATCSGRPFAPISILHCNKHDHQHADEHINLNRIDCRAKTRAKTKTTHAFNLLAIPRGGSIPSPLAMVAEVSSGLQSYMKGPKADTMILLLATALNTPICQKFNFSPILGFLSLGLLFGPNGKNLIKDVHTTEMMADLGIVLFLFEMGIHLDLKTLMSMKRDVFGIGLSQFTITAVVIAGIAKLMGYSVPAMIIIGWSLALSSSAFVLQLLKDKNEMSSQYGKASFGTLLLQDLMVVPLLVITPILAGNGKSPQEAIAKALVQITMALSAIGLFGKVLLNPLFHLVGASDSQEAFIGIILATVLGMSFMTEGLGLSNTLGAFLSGMLIAETKHRHNVEVAASPFRGILVGLFFFTVGFEIDLKMILAKPAVVASTVAGILAVKALITTGVCRAFDLPMSIAQRVGFVLAQGGEFAFVAFRTARSAGILTDEQTKMLLTCVSLTMALTPSLENFGGQMALKLETNEKKS
jgi:monovalent cation:proton antiporter-2 (CPA2) family protein